MADGPPCQSSRSQQSSTTPGQYDLLRKQDIPRADGPPLIEPTATEPDYTAEVSNIPIGKLTYSNFTDKYIEPSSKHMQDQQSTHTPQNIYHPSTTAK